MPKDLLEDALDGKGITECEKRTLEYTMANLKYTEEAKKVMLAGLNGEQQDQEIDGVKYDTGLLEKAKAFAKDGQISAAEAKDLLDDASDGKCIPECKKRTLEYTMANLKYTDKAKRVMLAGLNKEQEDQPTNDAKEEQATSAAAKEEQ